MVVESKVYRKEVASYAPGRTVKILYDPKNPRLSTLASSSLNYPFLFVIGLASLAFVIGCEVGIFSAGDLESLVIAEAEIQRMEGEG